MKNKSTIYWILAAVFLFSTIIDLIDIYLPKLISSVFLTIGFVLLALGQGPANKTVLNKTALFCFLISLSAVVYRLFLYFQPT